MADTSHRRSPGRGPGRRGRRRRGNLLRDDTGWRLGGPVAVAIVLGLAVLLQRRWPVPVLVVSSAAAFLGVLWDPFAATALVLHVVARGRDRLLPLLGACAVVAATAPGGTQRAAHSATRTRRL
ncbi:hypothetical protein [Amycolatopsis ruanii]|uniref:hypothetical protein n=1 Tax=Amycolatopsis ruanii TaxID=944491 RepID=UPI0013BEA861|nr:hypothetical protein [Amycolatopsis ruanii]